MIIDVILDRKGWYEKYEKESKGGGAEFERWYREEKGWWHSAKRIYEHCATFGFDDLARALDGGTDADVKRELCKYIDDNGYNPEIKDYINSVQWIFD